MPEYSGPVEPRAAGETVRQLLIHPVLDKGYVASPHPDGQIDWLGDALGTDFLVMRFHDGWARLHEGDGTRNEDCFGWGASVLAPIDGVVVDAAEPDSHNTPGQRDGGTTGRLAIRREDGVFVVLGHIMDLQVEVGQRVTAGQPVARVGNNGTSWAPHVHVGAWKDGKPLQLVVDLVALGRIMAEQGEAAYYGLPSEFTTTGT